MKQMTPNRFGRNEEQWREWQEEVRGFIDASRSGMKALLREIEKEGTGSIKREWVAQKDRYWQRKATSFGER